MFCFLDNIFFFSESINFVLKISLLLLLQYFEDTCTDYIKIFYCDEQICKLILLYSVLAYKL